jgi:site-specific DNA-cytosine methylase
MEIKMRVLVACEESQEVCKAFRLLGHEAYSCDILPCSGGHPGWHFKKDVFEVIELEHWDLMIAHPPCTHLCVSGARWFTNGYKDIKLRDDALEFVKKLMNVNIERIAIENPISIISTKIRKPDQIIRPFQFGENSTKAICLWLKNLPKLKETKVITPTKHTSKSGLVYDEWWFNTCLISDLTERAKVRSKTFPGIAKAMANQWGKEQIEVLAL